MALKVIYMDYSSYKINDLKKDGNDYYILTPNTWDDTGYKTTFEVQIIKDGELYSSMTRKILFENQHSISKSSDMFDKFREEERITIVDLEEFIKEYSYISLGADYEQMKKLFPNDFEEILVLLNDIIYLKQKDKDNPLILLQEHEGFSVSLCRDQSSKKVLEEGKYFLFPEETIQEETAEVTMKTETKVTAEATVEKVKGLKDDRYKFDFAFKLFDRNYKYEFSFVDKVLPNRINILIGKNGSGKSQTLKVLSDYFINQKETIKKYAVKVKTVQDGVMVESDKISFIQNTMVIAYNPYENFTEYSPYLKDYNYLGFRRLQNFNENIDLHTFKTIKNGFNIATFLFDNYDLEIKKMALLKRYGSTYDDTEFISQVLRENPEWSREDVSQVLLEYIASVSNVITDIELPTKITFDSFESAYNIDYENLSHENRIENTSILNSIFKYMKEAVKEIKYIALCLNDNCAKEKYESINNHSVEFNPEIRQIIIQKNLNLAALPKLDFSDFNRALVFLDENKVAIPFSSGQQVFINLIIFLLSMIKKDSLVIIDEPENTLHPNYEIKYIEILYTILKDYKSFCIIATHSAIITREIPKKFVNIIDIDSEKQPDVLKPVINTFGANLTHINNYIFDDLFEENKQFQIRLKELMSLYDSFEDFRKDFENKLNYEMLISAKQYWKLHDQN